MNRTVPLLAALAAVLVAIDARAQSARWTDHGYIDVSGWYQPGAMRAEDVVHPIDFVEAATVNTSYKLRSIPGFDAGGGVRVWRNLAVGANVSRFAKSVGGSVSARVPHPFFFDRPRAVSGDASNLKRDETAVHLRALWMIPVTTEWQIAIAGGPSWFNVRQDLVTDVTVTETYPFDTATFAGVTSERRSRSRAGFNVGADVDYMPRPHVGVGVEINFSHARVRLSDTAMVDAGGPHVGGGVRFRF